MFNFFVISNASDDVKMLRLPSILLYQDFSNILTLIFNTLCMYRYFVSLLKGQILREFQKYIEKI